ncbi:hypothetical protein IEO70_17460 [Bacillus sp. AGMB 02131]|uniref:Histidine phosphatase family protein n=1 Tax=Peribacillus faecalis TaxID=2772559 RepID=A0A927HE42_9BACI|nr:hypothetical protein [Peribacillus faecalis]MBD3110123.1 hypothetical protein [Peribacillus faecalis]
MCNEDIIFNAATNFIQCQKSEDLNPPIDPNRKTYGDFFVQYNGKSDIQVEEQMNNCLTDLMKKNDHRNVLAVSHSVACYAFLI